MSDPYARYDYAWQTPGWSAQDPVVNYNTDGYVEPGMPSDVTVVKVYGSWLEWGTGRPLEGVVQFRLSNIMVHGPSGQQVMPGVIRRRFRRDGFVVYLPATDDPQLTPSTTRYQCRLTVAGKVQEFEFALPANSPTEGVNILNLIPA